MENYDYKNNFDMLVQNLLTYTFSKSFLFKRFCRKKPKTTIFINPNSNPSNMTNIPLQQLKSEYSNCTKCKELCNFRSQTIFGSGDLNASVLLIGEAPGKTEDEQGIPFCGASGKILQELLESINLTREEVFITNTILCRPPKNRNPKKDEIQNCNDRLFKTIQAINPKVIVTIGNFASKTILKKEAKPGITKIRGQVFQLQIEDQKYQVVPVVHPANLLYIGRNPVILEQMKKDFQVVIETTESND